MNILRIALYCLIGGLVITFAAAGTGGFAWWWLAGILFAAAFVPVARFGPRGVPAQFGVIVPVFLIVTLACTWSEALIFLPEFQQHVTVRDFVAAAVMYAIFAAVLAALAVLLNLRQAERPRAELRPARTLVPLVLVCGLAYAFYYLVFGSITYQFFTKQYNPHAAELVARVGVWFWPIQIARGVVMTLAVLPVIRTLRLSRWQTAIAVGVLIWVTGGLAPLVQPNIGMGPRQRFAHVIEILTQNASLGITAGLLLLRRKPVASANAAPTAAVAA
jgi:hypothetical protein